MIEKLLADLKTNGFVVSRRAVDPALIKSARVTIEQKFESDIKHADRSQIEAWTNRSFVPSIESDYRLLNLYRRSPLATIGEYILSPHRIGLLERAQVQIRLASQRPAANAQPIKDWHCDGIACPHLPPGRLNTFQLLFGVLLTDLPHASGGAVSFRIGGHQLVAAAFRDNKRFPAGQQVPAEVLELPIKSICGKAGDAIISHHMTPHAVGANKSEVDRIMVYFRLRVTDHETIAALQLKDLWVRMPRLATI